MFRKKKKKVPACRGIGQSIIKPAAMRPSLIFFFLPSFFVPPNFNASPVAESFVGDGFPERGHTFERRPFVIQ